MKFANRLIVVCLVFKFINNQCYDQAWRQEGASFHIPTMYGGVVHDFKFKPKHHIDERGLNRASIISQLESYLSRSGELPAGQSLVLKLLLDKKTLDSTPYLNPEYMRTNNVTLIAIARTGDKAAMRAVVGAAAPLAGAGAGAGAGFDARARSYAVRKHYKDLVAQLGRQERR